MMNFKARKNIYFFMIVATEIAVMKMICQNYLTQNKFKLKILSRFLNLFLSFLLYFPENMNKVPSLLHSGNEITDYFKHIIVIIIAIVML